MKRILVATAVAIMAATVLPYAQSEQTIPVTDAESSSIVVRRALESSDV